MTDLAERVRAILAGRSVREVRMFGGLSFMVDGEMLVAVGGDDSLLVRVDPDRGAELVEQPGVEIAEMGRGRSMGLGRLRVAPDALRGAALDDWIEIASARRRG